MVDRLSSESNTTSLKSMGSPSSKHKPETPHTAFCGVFVLVLYAIQKRGKGSRRSRPYAKKILRGKGRAAACFGAGQQTHGRE